LVVVVIFIQSLYATADLYLSHLYFTELVSPLQGPPAPTSQIPICATWVSLLGLLLPSGVPEYVCAFATVANPDDESIPSPTIVNKHMSVPPFNRVALCTIPHTDPIARFSLINCYMHFVGNKQFKRFIAKYCTNFLLSH
jgi:hypothetical protein